MSDSPPGVVLDTVVFVQALISGRGPAAACIEQLRAGRFILLQSEATLNELREVPLRRNLSAKYPVLTRDRVEAFVAEIISLAVLVPTPATAFQLARDPADEPFIDLAVAGGARFIVTWNDRHLTYLMRKDTEEGRAFCAKFPGLRILSPPEFLSAIGPA
jgi:putative PIN family toxin of toxin-antitoxin system